MTPCDKCRIPCDIISDECLLSPREIARTRPGLVRDGDAIATDRRAEQRERQRRHYYENHERMLATAAAYRLSRKNRREVMAAVKMLGK